MCVGILTYMYLYVRKDDTLIYFECTQMSGWYEPNDSFRAKTRHSLQPHANVEEVGSLKQKLPIPP